MNVARVESQLRYQFRDKKLLKEALTHRSYLNENRDCLVSNERLEFLGDSILGMIISEHLFKTYNGATEGELTRRKREFVDRTACHIYIEHLGILENMYVGKGVVKSSSIGADLFEAILGAVYLDSDYDTVVKFFFDHFKEVVHNGVHEEDPKTMLQNYLQKEESVLPEYRVEKVCGEEHAREYHIAVYSREKKIGVGVGSSIKEAQKAAAKDAL